MLEEEHGKREVDPRHGGDSEPAPAEVEVTEKDEDVAELFMDDGIDIDAIEAKEEDSKIVYHAMLGHDLTEAYSNGRLQACQTLSVA